VDVKPIISHQIEFGRYAEAFKLAADREQAMKVQLSFI